MEGEAAAVGLFEGAYVPALILHDGLGIEFVISNAQDLTISRIVNQTRNGELL